MQPIYSPVSEAPANSPIVSVPARIEGLDCTKGALILAMVAYHAINYSSFRPLAYRFLAFLPPSFILITGFLVGQVYATKYDLGTWRPYLRLVVRGLKLLAIFVGLNLAHCVVAQRSFLDGMWDFTDRSDAILLSGNGRAGIFEVLLPISYFLLLAPALLWLRGSASRVIALSAVVVFALCCALELNGKSFKNLTLLSAGIVGMALGLIPMGAIDRFASRWVLAVLLYVAYRVCGRFYGETYPIQMFGAVVSLLVLYCCALHFPRDSWFGRHLVTWGKYSLVGYLAQIAVLQVIVLTLGGKPDRWLGVIEVGSLTTVALFFLIQAVHRGRQRSQPIDVIYRAIFA